MDAKLYIQRLPAEISPVRKRWMGSFLNLLKKDKEIFEIGSGIGYDSNYIEQKGYKIIRSDINDVFIRHQKKKFDNEVVFFDVIDKNSLGSNRYEAIFANAVLTMFSPFKLNIAVKNIRKILKKNGVFAFNLPLEWGIEDVDRFLNIHKFEMIRYYKDKVWFYLIVRKVD